MLVVSSSPAEFSKIVFPRCDEFLAHFEVTLQKQLLSVAANHTKSAFFYSVKISCLRAKAHTP